ncbi:GtrA family protein [Pontimonas sp.]|nr:GtrA family protein [Pontimonas sp.]
MRFSTPRKQFVGFLFAGGVATGLNYGVFLLLLFVGLNYLLASAVGYMSGIVVSFALNRWAVYSSRGDLRQEFFRYVAVYLLALGLQLCVLQVLVWSGLEPVWANAVAIALVVVTNFFIVRRFVFR